MRLSQFNLIQHSTLFSRLPSLLRALVVLLAAPGAVGQTIHVTVPANPLWTDTGIVLTAGQTVTVSASGTWNYAFGPIGPDGDPNYFAGVGDEFGFFDIVDHGRLLGFIGADPLQGEWGNGTFFPQVTGYISVGSGQTFRARSAGKLWLGINDGAVSKGVSDNSGQMVAIITLVTGDVTAPIIKIKSPVSVYALNQKIATSYTCTDRNDMVVSCAGPVANGGNADTSTLGPHAFTVVAKDSHGNFSSKTAVYTVAPAGLAPTSLVFKPQALGTTSVPRKVRLVNQQDVPLNISGIGTGGGFVETATTCGSALPAHKSCTISVSSKPGRTGSQIGSLHASDDLGTQSIILVGVGK